MRDTIDVELLREALSVALDAIDHPAFVVYSNGRAVLANARGREWLATHSTEPGALLPTALSSSPKGCEFRVSPIRGQSGAGSYLLVAQSDCAETNRRLANARDQWQLTRAETRVFERLGKGTSNKMIARELDCSVRTVELHVSSILKKAGVRSRAELIAKLWVR